MPTQLPYNALDLIPFGGDVSSAVANLPTSQNNTNIVFIYDWTQILITSTSQLWEDTGVYQEGNIRANTDGDLYVSLQDNNGELLGNALYWEDMVTNSADVGDGFVLVSTAVDYTASNREIVYCDTSGVSENPAVTKFVVTLPDDPEEGAVVVLRDISVNANYQNIQVNSGNSYFLDASQTQQLNYPSFDVMYYFSGTSWVPINNISWMVDQFNDFQTKLSPSLVQLPDVVRHNDQSHTIDYSLGNKQNVTYESLEMSNLYIYFSNFVSGEVCYFYLDVTHNGDIAYKFPSGTLLPNGGITYTYPPFGTTTDSLLIMSDKNDDYYVYQLGTNMIEDVNYAKYSMNLGSVYSSFYDNAYDKDMIYTCGRAGESDDVLYAINVSDPENMSLSGSLVNDPDIAYHSNVVISQGILYVLSSTNFSSVHVDDPANMIIAQTLIVSDTGGNLVAKGDYILYQAGPEKIISIDVSDHNQMSEAHSVDIPGGNSTSTGAMAVEGDYAYLPGTFANGGGRISAVNISDPANMYVENTIHSPYFTETASSFAVIDGYAYFSSVYGYKWFNIVDVRNVSNMAVIFHKSGLQSMSNAKGFIKRGNKIYFSSGDNMMIMDVTDPAKPKISEANILSEVYFLHAHFKDDYVIYSGYDNPVRSIKII